MEDLVMWLTSGSPNIDAFFVARLVVTMMGLELFVVGCGLLARMRK